jgi:hypothetical protein
MSLTTVSLNAGTNPARSDGKWPHQLPLTTEQEEFLKQIYYVEGNQFGRQKLFELVSERNRSELVPRIYREQIMTWLRQQESWQLTKPRPVKTSTQAITAPRPGAVVQADTMDLGSLAYNRFRYVLVLVDVYSRFLWTKALRQITSAAVNSALADFVEKMIHRPGIFFTDNGFVGIEKATGVKHVTGKAYTATSQALVERCNGTLRRVIVKNALSGNKDWPALLENITDTYNNTKHRSIKLTPYQVYVEGQRVADQEELERSEQLPKLKVGDKVRIRTDSKGQGLAKNQPLWTKEVYEIKRVVPATLGRLEAYSLESKKGFYNASYLQKVAEKDEFLSQEEVTDRPAHVVFE